MQFPPKPANKVERISNSHINDGQLVPFLKDKLNSEALQQDFFFGLFSLAVYKHISFRVMNEVDEASGIYGKFSLLSQSKSLRNNKYGSYYGAMVFIHLKSNIGIALTM